MFKNPFSFKGRIRRTEYGLSILISNVSIYYAITTVSNAEMQRGDTKAILIGLFIIVQLWFYFAQGVKRFHDMGESGWFSFLTLLPVTGIIWPLFTKGELGKNKYG